MVLPDFLGHPLPVPDAEAVEIMAGAIVTAMALCADYRAEKEATVEFVGKSLKDHGIAYSPKSGGRRD